MSTKISKKQVKRRRASGKSQVGSLTAVAYQMVKDAILRNHLHPGEPLPIERLVRELG